MGTADGQFEIIPTRDDPTIIHRNFRAIRSVFNNLLLSTTLTTKGDLLTYSTTAIRKAVGSDGHLLFPKASESDGLEWRAAVASDISDFSEAVDDRVNALVTDGTGITTAYDDGAGTLTFTVTLAPFSTADLSEGSNLYYTDERVDDRVSALIQDGGGITWTYDDMTGTLTGSISISGFTTDDLSEGASNLYFTEERVDDRVSALIQDGGGITWTYSDVGGTLTPAVDHGSVGGLGDDDHTQYHNDARALTWLGTRSTTDLPEGSNLYYTNARADARIAAANLEDVGDVVAYATLADGEILVYNTAAGGWRHRTLAEAGVSATGHTHTLSDITDSGTAAALNVPASGDAASGEVVKGDDTRLTDSRDPTAHASSHTDGTDDIQSATSAQKGLMTSAYASKLDGIEAGATADQTDAEIRAAVEAATDSNVFTDADHTKLDGIEASADVTDATNVNAAGAVMHTDISESQGILRKTGSETYEAVAVKWDATAAPTANDDAGNTSGNGTFAVGSRWIDVTNDKEYVCLDSAATSAVWSETTAGSGSGDVTGPASSSDNAIARFDGTTGKIIQNSGVTLGDTGLMSFGGSAGHPLIQSSNSSSAPGYSFATESDTGFYNNATNTIGVACNAALIADFSPIGLTIKSTYNLDMGGHAVDDIAVAADADTTADDTLLTGGYLNARRASQAEMEAATSTTQHVTPGRQHYHPSASKAWVNFQGTSTVSIRDSYNVSSITDNGTGDYDANFSTSFSGQDYCPVGSTQSGTFVDFVDVNNTALQAGAVNLRVVERTDSPFTTRDEEAVYLVVFGDQ